MITKHYALIYRIRNLGVDDLYRVRRYASSVTSASDFAACVALLQAEDYEPLPHSAWPSWALGFSPEPVAVFVYWRPIR